MSKTDNSEPIENYTNEKIDLFQLWSYIYSNDVNILHPDGASNLFAKFFNRTGRYSPMTQILKELAKLSDKKLFHITCVENKKTIIKTYNSHNGKKTKTLKDGDLLFLEYDQESFGHYCSAFVEGKKIFIFDSMLRFGEKDDDSYNEVFQKIICDNFGKQEFVVNFDLSESKQFKQKNLIIPFSLEITGGSFNVSIPHIYRQKRAKKEWKLASYILGPDNQNQYCYMWAIFHLMCKVFSHESQDMFVSIVQKIIDHDVVPVFFIKSLIIGVIFPELTRGKESSIGELIGNKIGKETKGDSNYISDFFAKYYPTIVSNSSCHSKIYLESNADFRLFQIKCNELRFEGINMKENFRCFIEKFSKSGQTLFSELNEPKAKSSMLDKICKKKKDLVTSKIKNKSTKQTINFFIDN